MISLFNYCKTPFCTGRGGHRKSSFYYLRKFQEDTSWAALVHFKVMPIVISIAIVNMILR